MVDDMTENLMISTEEKNPNCKKFKSFISNVGKKEDALANKTATLTKKKNGLIYTF